MTPVPTPSRTTPSCVPQARPPAVPARALGRLCAVIALGTVMSCASAGGGDAKAARQRVPADGFPATLCLSYGAARSAALARGEHRLALEVRRAVPQPSGGGGIEVEMLSGDGQRQHVGSVALHVDGSTEDEGGGGVVQRFQFALRGAPAPDAAERLCFLVDQVPAPGHGPVALEIALSWLEPGAPR